MSERDIKLLLEDIQEAVKKILSYTAGMTFDDFMDDAKTKDAVIRNFGIIGQASNKIPVSFHALHPEIQWRRIIGFRNRIIHEYFEIDYEIVWQIKEENLQELEGKMDVIIAGL